MMVMRATAGKVLMMRTRWRWRLDAMLTGVAGQITESGDLRILKIPPRLIPDLNM